MSEGFFTALSEVRRILSSGESLRLQFLQLKEILKDDDVRREFWGMIQSPDWLPILRREGFFDVPPAPPNGAVISWPASKYLVRVVKEQPVVVSEILANVSTDNPSVLSDIVDAALAMPASDAKRLVPSIAKAARDRTLWLAFMEAAELCASLVESGQAESAFELLEALYRPSVSSASESLPTHHDYWYVESLKKLVPRFIAIAPTEFIKKICDWLQDAADAKRLEYEYSDAEYSCMWRPAIEDHEQNNDYDFIGRLVVLVRDGLEAAIRTARLSLDGAISIVDGYQSQIFRRLKLHLINRFAEADPELARREIMNVDCWDEDSTKHEYARLVGERWPLLTAEDQEVWLAFVDNGPLNKDPEFVTVSRKLSEAEQEKRRKQLDRWKLGKLHWIRDHLKSERRLSYERLQREYGKPKFADMMFHTEIEIGYRSPATIDDLRNKTFDEVIKFISNWKADAPGNQEFELDGLAEIFEQYIRDDIDRSSQHAAQMKQLQPIFVARFLNRMTECVRESQSVDVTAILELCNWLMQQSLDQHFDVTVLEHENTSWRWTREAVARFVIQVCEANDVQGARCKVADHRSSIASILNILCRQSNSAVPFSRSESLDPRTHDFLFQGLNTLSGKAMDALLAYAKWVGEGLEPKQTRQGEFVGGFSQMKEVQALLEFRLRGENCDFASMAILGSHVGVVRWLDQRWLEAHVGTIFDLHKVVNDRKHAFGWAAWNAFLSWVQPHDVYFKLFKEQFKFAVEQASTITELPERDDNQPMYRLGQHLMILYGRGQLGINDSDGIMTRFLESALPVIRVRAFGFIGESLRESPNVPQSVVDRFMMLWDYYWKTRGRDDVRKHSEMVSFGTWFISGAFPAEWSLDRLGQVIDESPTPYADERLLKRLVEVADVDISRSLSILNRFIRDSRAGWHVYAWRNEAKAILEIAMRSRETDRSVAQSLIDFFGRSGYKEFGELLGLAHESN